MTEDDDQMRDRMRTQTRRWREARKSGMLGLLVTGGTAGLLLVLPLVAGAYLGRWLDEQSDGYSVRWTVNMILLGLAIGVYNVYLFFKEHGR